MVKQNVVAIDGPSGSGKSSVAKAVAHKMHLLYVDTGAMFRGLGHYFNSLSVDFSDDKTLTQQLSQLNFIYGKDSKVLIEINGQDMTPYIRSPEVSLLASAVSRSQVVRQFLLDIQRALPSGKKRCIMEGRDIGTVVFPNAFCKIFLTAKLESRALRRYLQLYPEEHVKKLSDLENNPRFQKVQEEMAFRDKKDSERDFAPLRPASDSFVLDSSELSFDQVVFKVMQIMSQKQNEFFAS